jgi:hypothetical protein
MSNSVNDIPVGLRIPSQIPLDAKVYKLSQADLAYLGPSSNLAYTYFKGMIAYCALEQTRWEWREPKFVGEVGLLPTNFLYPSNLIIFGIDYSQKSYNFFPSSLIGATGATGQTGAQGIPGTPGAVGPAGLEWRGTWSAAGVYVLDDAVSYGGSSWFCIDPVGPSATTPDLDPTNWALLAAQGAQGIQGIQGVPGVGANFTEESRNTSNLVTAQNPASTSSKITKTFTRGFVTSGADNYLGLSNTGKVTGEFFVVQNMSTTLNLIIVPLDNARFLQPNGFASQVNFVLEPNRYVRFTLADTTSGSDKVFMVEVINPLGASSGSQVPTTENLASNTNSAPFPDISKTSTFCVSTGFSYGLPVSPVTADVLYVRTVGVITLWSSPNPGNDGANNYFITPLGNGNTSMSLQAQKVYRFTFIGKYGGSIGYWTVEIMNNI